MVKVLFDIWKGKKRELSIKNIKTCKKILTDKTRKLMYTGDNYRDRDGIEEL